MEDREEDLKGTVDMSAEGTEVEDWWVGVQLSGSSSPWHGCGVVPPVYLRLSDLDNGAMIKQGSR